MWSKTNIETQLLNRRSKRISDAEISAEIARILEQNETEREVIKSRLTSGKNHSTGALKIDLLDGNRIVHLSDIRELCVDYRLRFLDASFFKGPIPEEAISIIRALESEHKTTLDGFKIMAPAKLLKLENADDPLLFAPLGNDYFYLIHKWGNDLHPLRKLLMWPYKTFENLVFTILLVSVALTAITPMQAFTKGEVTNQEYLLMFLFMFKAVAGIVLFYGFAKGKNFNQAIWNSPYYNG